MTSARMQRRVNLEREDHRAVAFADLAGYTALTEAHGDRARRMSRSGS